MNLLPNLLLIVLLCLSILCFWIQNVALARNLGFSAKELRDLEKLVIGNQQRLLEAWHEHFGH